MGFEGENSNINNNNKNNNNNNIMMIDDDNSEIISIKNRYWHNEFNKIKQENDDKIKSLPTSNNHTSNSKINDIRGDLPDSLFDKWYEFAIQYAQSAQIIITDDNDSENSNELEIEMICSTKVFLNNIIELDIISNSILEDGVYRKYLEQFRKVITIFSSKPKFSKLLISSKFENTSNLIKDQLNENLQQLLLVLQKRILTSIGKKMEILSSIRSIIEIGNKIQKELSFTLFPFQINTNILVSFSNSTDNGEVLRSLCLEILKLLIITNEESRDEILRSMSSIASENLTLNFIWSNNGISNKDSISILLNRIPTSQKQLGIKILASISACLKSGYIDILSTNHIDKDIIEYTIKTIFDFIDCYSNKIKNSTTENLTIENQESNEILEIFETLVNQLPNNQQIIKKLFKVGGCTEGTLGILQHCSKKFSRDMWNLELLPLLVSEIQLMKFQGVSGIQREQCVIDCVRECSRLFYLDSPKSLSSHSENSDIGSNDYESLKFAHNLFFTIIEAIRHGYIDSGSFQTVCSLIILNHLPSSVGWFNQFLNPHTCYNLKTSRAIYDIFLQLLGFSEVENSETIQSLKIDHMHIIFHQIVSISNPTAFSLISACLKYKQANQFLIDNPALLNTLIQSIRMFITEIGLPANINDESDGGGGNSTSQKYNDNNGVKYIKQFLNKEQAESVTELIKNLFPIVDPSDANFLFSISLKVLLLIPVGTQSSYGDEELSKLINRIPIGSPLSLLDVELGLKLCGTESKIALCDFSPNFCLLDSNEQVRSTALKVLLKRNDLIINNGGELIKSIFKSVKTNSKSSIYEMELLISASPLMPLIFNFDKSYTLESLELLYKAIKQSSLRDPLNRPNQSAIESTEYIINNLYQSDIELYIGKSSILISILVKLKKFSTQIKSIYSELKKKGVITYKNSAVLYQ